jgi:hypothetical protein
MASTTIPTNIIPKAIELTEDPTGLGNANFITTPINIQNIPVKLENKLQ